MISSINVYLYKLSNPVVKKFASDYWQYCRMSDFLEEPEIPNGIPTLRAEKIKRDINALDPRTGKVNSATFIRSV